MDQIVTGDSPLKVERLSGPLLWLTIAATGGFAFVCLSLLAWHALHDLPSTMGGLFEAMLLVMAASAAAAIWFTLRRAVTIYGDRIEATNGFSTTTLQRSEIKGYRRLPGALISLVPSDEFSKPLRVSAELLDDPLTQNWFARLPDLDARDAQPSPYNGDKCVDIPADDAPASAPPAETPTDDTTPNKAPADLAPDETPSAGQRDRLKNLTWTTSAVGVAIGAWTAFLPVPHAFAVLVDIAVMAGAIGLKLYFGPLISIASDRNHTDPRPSIAGMFIAPAFAIFFRAMWDFQLLDAWPAVWFAGGMALALGIFLVAHDRRLRSSMAIGVFAALAVFFFGALAEINAIFDVRQPVVYRTSIAGLYVRSGKSTSYEVTLGEWANQPAGHDVTVSREFYSTHVVGEAICVTLSQGWLGLRYYNVGDCR